MVECSGVTRIGTSGPMASMPNMPRMAAKTTPGLRCGLVTSIGLDRRRNSKHAGNSNDLAVPVQDVIARVAGAAAPAPATEAPEPAPSMSKKQQPAEAPCQIPHEDQPARPA